MTWTRILWGANLPEHVNEPRLDHLFSFVVCLSLKFDACMKKGSNMYIHAAHTRGWFLGFPILEIKISHDLIVQLPFWNHLNILFNASKKMINSFGWLWHLFEVIRNRIVVVAKLWAESFECVRKIKSTCVCCAWSVKKSKRQKNVYHVKLCSDVLADYANMNKNRKKVKKNINIPNFR